MNVDPTVWSSRGCGQCEKVMAMSARLFTDTNAWVGGGYEVAILLGSRNDDRLRKTLEVLWSSTELDGCYEHADREPSEQTKLQVDALPFESNLHGVATLPDRVPIACRSVVVRYDGGEDCVYFGASMGSLQRILPVGAFPFGSGDWSWRSTVDAWLCAHAARVFEAVPFRLAMVGFDGGDNVEITTSGIPEERQDGFLVPTNGRLEWFPPTRGPFSS
jgi:hypothetical protein